MRKTNKLYLAAGTALAAAVAFTACSSPVPPYDAAKRTPLDKNEETVTAPTNLETYNNYIEIYYEDNKKYDVGDPFVMKHGGTFYLYCSTPDASYEPTRTKIGCWSSANMVDWTWLGWAYEPPADQMKEGDPSNISFAPEVVYYKGWFYLCESQRGRGHYFFRSKYPNGPFTLISDNKGMGIDGSFFLADDGKLYFVSANNADASKAITAVPIDFEEGGTGEPGDVMVKLGTLEVIKAAKLGGWTEGPGVFKRNGYGYITYTGNHVDSASYRVGYATTTKENSLSEYTARHDNIVLATSGIDRPAIEPYGGDGNSVVDTFRGSGHSSDAVGPDLDGIFTAFHVANRTKHDNSHTGSGYRRYSLTQYFTNDSYLLTNGLGDYDRPKPSAPDFVADINSLAASGSLKVGDTASENVFTAEFSLILESGKGSVAVGVTDSGYTEIAVDGTTLTVNSVNGTTKKELGRATVSVSTNADSEHLVKVVNGADKCEVHYDNMNLVTISPVGGGKIGFGTGTPKSAAFTNDAFGTSDFETIKDLTGSWPLFDYMKGENRGWSLSKSKVDKNGVRQGEKETTKKVESLDARSTVLNRGDWVKYTVNAPEEGAYGLGMLASKESAGCIFEIIVDNKDIYKLQIPEKKAFGNSDYANVYTGSFSVPSAGLHIIKLRVYGKSLEAVNLFTEKDGEAKAVSDSLTAAGGAARLVMGTPSYSANGFLSTRSDDRTLLMMGNKGCADFEMSVDAKIVAGGTVGVIFRMNEFSYTNSASLSLGTLYSGYFLECNNNYVKLQRMYYDKKEQLAIAKPSAGNGFANGNTVKITIRAQSGLISVFTNGEEVISVFDPEAILTGYVGLYCEKETSMLFKDFTYGPLVSTENS